MSPRHLILAACISTLLAAAPLARAATTGELVGAGTVSTGLQETSATLTPDGATLYFTRSDFAEADDTIMLSRYVEGQWSTPEVAPFSGQWHDSEPALSPSGKRLYFVSNRPPHPGDKPVMAEMGGTAFPGTNLWYVEQQSDDRWGAPVHVDGALNDGAMIYNPSVAANGDIYFSAHRADSGHFYQIYVARRTATGLAPPQRLELGNIAHSRMDPGVAADGSFLVYAGNEGDALGRADIYITFRQADGHWGKPAHLDGGINSASLENAPSIGRRSGELYLSSSRRDDVSFPKPRDTRATLQDRLQQPLNGSRNLWRFDISALLKAHGIPPGDAHPSSSSRATIGRFAPG